MDIAERIQQELLHESAGIWYLNNHLASKIIVKAPSSTIKSLIKGCKIEFCFGRDQRSNPNIFHAGVRIYDDPINYLIVTETLRFNDEHSSLQAIMNRTETHLDVYNELNVCVAVAKVHIEVKNQMKTLNLLGNIAHLYTGDFTNVISKSLDCFVHSLDKSMQFESVYEIDNIVISAELSSWEENTVYFIGENEHNKIVCMDPKEGDSFEQQINAVMDSIFKDQVYRGPQIVKGNRKRELIDLLAFSDYGIFLIEAKALGILNTGLNRTMDRKVKGLHQQINKGINQLIGAVKTIANNERIYHAKNSTEIVFNRELLPHGIVLVSELFLFGDWSIIEQKILTTIYEKKVVIHVMDLKEFMKYIGNAKGNKDLLDDLLIKRAEKFVEHMNIHLSLNTQHLPQTEN